MKWVNFQICHILNAEEATKYPLNNDDAPSITDDAPSITKYGFLVWPHTKIVALCAHCAKGAPMAHEGKFSP